MIFDIPQKKYDEANTYKTRDCYDDLSDYINNSSTKVCVLYGLRRTGKSTMMFQAMNAIGLENVGYILCEDGDNYGELRKKINEYISENKKVVFIDEITKLSNFITSSASLADYYSGTGTKIVITGTDSLGLNLVKSGELYDRTEGIHTTYISYGEFSKLICNTDIDDFIHYAGVLSHEERESDRSFFNRETASRYIDSAISNNITNTFFRSRLPSSFTCKYDKLIGLHNRNILVPTITAIVEMYSGLITKDVLDAYFNQKPYFNADLSSALQLLEKHDLFIDRQKFGDNFEGQIAAAINSRRDIKDYVEPEAVSQIIDYLYDLELIVSIPIVRHNDNENAIKRGREYLYSTNEYIYQAGIKYCQAKAVIELIKKSNDIDLSPAEKEMLCQKLDEDVKGQILEVSVFHDTTRFLNKDRYDVFKMSFTGSKDGEIDMVIYDKQEKTHYCFEIKHSEQIDEGQQENLVYEPFQKITSDNYGTRKMNVVLYRGETNIHPTNEVVYLNAGDFLSELYRSQGISISNIIDNCIGKHHQNNKNNIDKPNSPSDKLSLDTERTVKSLSDFAKNVKQNVSEIISKEKKRVTSSFEYIVKRVEHGLGMSR